MDYLATIKNLSFDRANPFDVDQTFFENLRPVLGDSMYDRFIQDCYHYTITNTHRGEAFVIYVYRRAAQALGEGTGRQYFLEMSKDEQIHTDMMSEMQYRIYGDRVEYGERDFTKELDNFMRTFDPTEMLVRFFAGETKLVTMFAAFYKHCQSPEKKKFIGEFIAEETRHTNQMLETLADRLPQADQQQRSRLYANLVQDVMARAYWGKAVISQWFDDREQAKEFYQLAYSSDIAREYLEKMTHRVYQMAQLILPDVTYDRFYHETLIPELR